VVQKAADSAKMMSLEQSGIYYVGVFLLKRISSIYIQWADVQREVIVHLCWQWLSFPRPFGRPELTWGGPARKTPVLGPENSQMFYKPAGCLSIAIFFHTLYSARPTGSQRNCAECILCLAR